MKRALSGAGIITAGLLVLMTAPVLRAGEDVQFWEIFALDWKPAMGLKLELEKQLRYENSFSGLRSDHTEFGLSYELSQLLEVGADYRFIALGDETRDRLDGNIVLSRRWKSVTISNRARLQKEIVKTPAGRTSELVFRDRLRVTLRTGKSLQPYFGGEFFQGLNEAGRSENKYRLTGGLDYNLTKRVTLTFYYHYQHDLGELTNETAHIIAGRFRYSF